MAPVHASREDGKVTVRFSTWLVPVLIAVFGFGFGFIVNSVRADSNTAIINDTIERRIKIIEEREEQQRPASEMVSKDEFNATVSGMKDQINRIDSNVQKLVEIQIRRNGK